MPIRRHVLTVPDVVWPSDRSRILRTDDHELLLRQRSGRLIQESLEARLAILAVRSHVRERKMRLDRLRTIAIEIDAAIQRRRTLRAECLLQRAQRRSAGEAQHYVELWDLLRAQIFA